VARGKKANAVLFSTIKTAGGKPILESG